MAARLELVTDERALASVAGEWDELLAGSRQDSQFLRHGRLSAWWRCFAGDGELAVALYRGQADELLGVLPTFRVRTGTRVRAITRRFLGDVGIGSCSLSPFARVDVEQEVFAAFAEHLMRPGRDWHVIDLAYMDADSPFLALLRQHPSARYTPDCAVSQRILLPGDWDSYLKMLSSRRRSSVRSALARAEREGLTAERIVSAGDLPEALDDFWRLHEQRMKTKLGEGFEADPRYKEFVARMAAEQLAEGRLWLTFLRKGDRRVSVLYQHHYGGVVYGEKSGFVDDDGSADVLRPLLAGEIRRAIEGGFRVYDLMQGEDPYKAWWGVNDVGRFAQVRVYSRSLSGRLRRHRDVVAERVEASRTVR